MGLQLSQQVNLFQSEFQVRRKIVCAKNVQTLFVTLLLFLVSISTYDYLFERSQTNYLAKLKSEHSNLTLSLQKIKNEAPSMVVDSKLKQQVENYKSDVFTKQQVLDALSGQSFGNTAGFSEFFTGLSKQNVAGLWLTNLSISNGGKDIGINGSAYRAELIPDFLTNLSNEQVFQGTNFKTFRVLRQKNPERVDFYVDTNFNELMP